MCGLVLFSNIPKAFSEEPEDTLAQAKARYSKYQNSAKDITLFQQMDMTTPDGQVIQEAKWSRKGKKFRLDLKLDLSNMGTIPAGMAQAKSTIIFDGMTTWMVSAFTGKKEIPYPENQPYQRESSFLEHLLQNGEGVREEMVGNYDCVVAEVKDEKDISYTLWIEKGTCNTIQIESEPLDSGKVSFWNSDFRKVKNDWEIPYKTEVYIDGKLVSTNTVKSVQTNLELPDALFDPDKAVAQVLNAP